jgi:hypothetical protein
MPIDTDSMNAVFITDHGSSRVTSSLALRGPTGRGAAAGAETEACGATTGDGMPEPARGSTVTGGAVAGATTGRVAVGGTETPAGLPVPAGLLPPAGAAFVTGIGAVELARPVPALEAVPSVSTEPAP